MTWRAISAVPHLDEGRGEGLARQRAEEGLGFRGEEAEVAGGGGRLRAGHSVEAQVELKAKFESGSVYLSFKI